MRPATAQEYPRPQVIQRADLLKVLANKLEHLFQPQRHDAAQMLEVDGLERQAKLVRDSNRLPLDGVLQKAGAVFELELLSTAEGHLQAVCQVVRHVITADREHA